MNKVFSEKVFFEHASIKRIVILGHTGFIGSRLLSFFQNQHPEIEIVGHSLPQLDLANHQRVLSLADLFDRETIVIMCSGIKKQWGDNLDIFLQNIKMVINLSYLLEKHPVRRFIYFSSAEVYGEDMNNMSIGEDTPVNPTSYYGIAKYTSECLLRNVIKTKNDSSLLILRPPLVYGPGDTSKGYGPVGFVEQAINRKEITLWGDGTECRDLIFIDDLIKIVYRLSFHEYDGVINIASGLSHTFQEMVGIIARFLPFEPKISSRPRSKQKVDMRFSNRKLIELLPDISFTKLEYGIKNILDMEYRSTRVKCKVKKGIHEHV